MLQSYYPEMGEQPKPETQIFARLGHYGRHYFIYTKLELKGRGIEFLETCSAETMVSGSKFIGFNRYKVTENAMNKLEEKYAVANEMLL